MNKNRNDTYKVIIEIADNPPKIDIGIPDTCQHEYSIGVGYAGISIKSDTSGKKSKCQFRSCGAYTGNREENFKAIIDTICNSADEEYSIFEDEKKATIYGRVIKDSDLPEIAAIIAKISGSSNPIYMLAYDNVPKDVLLRAAMPHGISTLVSITGQNGICYQIKNGELVANTAKETGFKSRGLSAH